MSSNKKGNERPKREAAARPEGSIIDFGDFDFSEPDTKGVMPQDMLTDMDMAILSDITDEPAENVDLKDEHVFSDYFLGADDMSMSKTDASRFMVEDNIEDFFENYEYSRSSSVDEFVDEVSRVIGGEEERLNADAETNNPLPSQPEQQTIHKEKEPEPDLIMEARKYAAGGKSLKVRFCVASVVALISFWLTVTFEHGGSLPFGMEESLLLTCGALLLMHLISAALSIDVLWKGIRSVFRLSFCAESLIAVSGIFTFVDGMYILAQQSVSFGLPFCTLFCISSLCALVGEYCYRSSMSDSLTDAAMLPAQIGVISDVETLDGRTVIKKASRSVSGFYSMVTQEDCAEKAYRTAAPLFLILAAGFAALVSIGKDDSKIFLHAFAALISVAASFTSVLAYAIPFRMVTSFCRKAGAAIAGWGAAQEVTQADGALLVDEDIFPAGTIGIENATVYGEDKQKAVLAASSLIIASGSGMGRCFADLLSQQRLSMARVYNFSYSESGGIQGIIKGERVFVGNSGYMNLLGIRIPTEKEKNNAVYLAIGKKLYARFDMTYLPANAVQKAILSLCKAGVNLLFAVRDFNVTPASVRQKFKVSTDDFEHLTVPECYSVTENRAVANSDCLAVLGKDGAGAFASAIAGCCTLRNMALVSTVVSVAGSAVGLLLMFSLFWFGGNGVIQVSNLLLYMITNVLVQAILTIFTRKT